MDLKCVNPANGPFYYQDCLAKVGEKQLLAAAGANRLRVGDRVSVCLDAEVLKAMAQGHGGWIDNMAEVRQLFFPTLPPPPPPPRPLFSFLLTVFGVSCEFCRN